MSMMRLGYISTLSLYRDEYDEDGVYLYRIRSVSSDARDARAEQVISFPAVTRKPWNDCLFRSIF